MPIRDKSIGWKEGRIYVPLRAFQGLDNTGTHTQTLSQGTPTIEAITTSEIVGLPMTDADEICHIMAIPRDLNRDKKVLGRIYFQHAAAGADSPEFIWTSKFFKKQEALSEFVAGADKSTSFAAHLCSTTNPSLEVTAWNDLSWESYIEAADILYALSIELHDDGGGASDENKLLAIELAYEIEATQTHRQRSRNIAAANPV